MINAAQATRSSRWGLLDGAHLRLLHLPRRVLVVRDRNQESRQQQGREVRPKADGNQRAAREDHAPVAGTISLGERSLAERA
jgi:hypothetical protein